MSSALLVPSPAKQTNLAAANVEPDKTGEIIHSAFGPETLSWRGLDRTVTMFLVAVHLGSLAAPFFFSWPGLIACVALHWLTCSIGICLGYHRYLAHKSFKLRAPGEFFVMFCAAISGQGSPVRWAAVHRLHHHKSDLPGDPHTPLDGTWWSHLLWLFPGLNSGQTEALDDRYVPELQDRPIVMFFERTYALWLWGFGLVLLGSGWLYGGWELGVSMVLWGMCVRLVISYHSTWFVNSATHLWGYRNYETRDDSRNLWWVAILSYGEGWHNNHHAYPSVAPSGHRWWELDMTWFAIRLLRACGLAYDVRDRISSSTSAPDVPARQSRSEPAANPPQSVAAQSQVSV